MSCRYGLEPYSLFFSGVLRVVYSVLERLELGETDSESIGGRRRKTWRSGNIGVSNQVLGARQHVLRTGTGCSGTSAERTEIFPRRFRAAHPGPGLCFPKAIGEPDGNDLRRRQTVPSRREAKLATRMSLAGLQPAVLLLAWRSRVGGRVPPVCRQRIQG